MMSLFSSFDLQFYSFALLISAMFIFGILSSLFKVSQLFVSFNYVMSSLEEFFLSLKMKSFNKGFIVIFSSIFLMLFLINFSSVLSFNFAMTSQVSMVLFLGLTLWSSFILFSISKSFKSFLTHCVPEGTPMYLIWFLFFIELVSNSIRPLTVTVRLVANILAGHLLMILLSKLVLSLAPCVIFYIILNIVEFFISLIQAYIFSTMLVLYYADVS